MLTKEEILKLFELLNKELKKKNVIGELYLVGGAVMCLVYYERASTKDVDALFVPSSEIREAARKISSNKDWLNDAVKWFFSKQGSFSSFLELTNLKIFCAKAEYLLAMKCLAMRIGKEFHDLDDVRYLLRYLNVEDYNSALKIICEYYPIDRFPRKTLYALEELLTK